MEGLLSFGCRARAAAFCEALADFATAEESAAFRVGKALFELSQSGKPDAAVAASVSRLRRRFGGEALEAGAASVSPAGGSDWLIEVEERIAPITEIGLRYPIAPRPLPLGLAAVRRDGLWFRRTGETLHIEAPEGAWRAGRTRIADAIDCAALTWRWQPGEGGFIRDSDKTVRSWGRQQDLFAAAAA